MRRSVALTVVVAVLLAGAVAVAPVYFGTDAGHRQVAHWLEASLTNAIPGSVNIAAIDSLAPSRIRVRGLVLRDPQRNQVLSLYRATIDLDWGRALRGELGFDSAQVDGGTLIIAVQPDGRTSLEAALSAPSHESQEAGNSGGGLQCDLRNIHVQHLALVLRPAKDQRFEVQDTDALVHVWRDHTPGIRVDLARVSGAVSKPHILGSQLELVRADGWVHGAETEVLQLTFATALGDSGKVSGKIRYFDREQTPVLLDLEPSGSAKAQLASAFVDLRASLGDTVGVDLH